MKYRGLCLSMIATGVVATVCFAAIPLPDTVLYGWVYVDGQLQGAADNVTVIARVDGVENPVGRYRLGDHPGAGDRYVLHIRLESLADGSTQGNNAARVGDVVHISVKRGEESEQPVTDFVIPAQGHIQRMDLPERMLGDWNRDTKIALDDFAEFHSCMEGPGADTTVECLAVFDFDDNDHVDLADYGELQGRFTGS